MSSPPSRVREDHARQAALVTASRPICGGDQQDRSLGEQKKQRKARSPTSSRARSSMPTHRSVVIFRRAPVFDLGRPALPDLEWGHKRETDARARHRIRGAPDSCRRIPADAERVTMRLPCRRHSRAPVRASATRRKISSDADGLSIRPRTRANAFVLGRQVPASKARLHFTAPTRHDGQLRAGGVRRSRMEARKPAARRGARACPIISAAEYLISGWIET